MKLFSEKQEESVPLSPSIKDLLQNIRTKRKEVGYSQECVAYELGIDLSTYGKIERGLIPLRVDRMEKIASVLGVNVADIYPQSVQVNQLSEI